MSIGTITRIDKSEGALFQSAEVTPEVDAGLVEEVLVIQSPNLQTESERSGNLKGKRKP